MSEPEDPWGRPPPWHADRRFRLALWLGLVGVVGVGLWTLLRAFPRQLSSGGDWYYVARGVALVALVSSGILYTRRLRLKETARDIAIWAAVAAVLVLGFSFRGEVGEALTRMRSELIPAYAVSAGPHALALTESQDDNFYAMGQVNGQPVRFLVDTGASDIVLSPADAQRIGVDVGSLQFSGSYETANGVGRGAPFTAAILSVGPIRFTDVPMSINQAPMNTSLLGMTFFKRLESFEIRDRRLVLKWRS